MVGGRRPAAHAQSMALLTGGAVDANMQLFKPPSFLKTRRYERGYFGCTSGQWV
jgi:hypothetical protein